MVYAIAVKDKQSLGNQLQFSSEGMRVSSYGVSKEQHSHICRYKPWVFSNWKSHRNNYETNLNCIVIRVTLFSMTKHWQLTHYSFFRHSSRRNQIAHRNVYTREHNHRTDIETGWRHHTLQVQNDIMCGSSITSNQILVIFIKCKYNLFLCLNSGKPKQSRVVEKRFIGKA